MAGWISLPETPVATVAERVAALRMAAWHLCHSFGNVGEREEEASV